MHNGREFARYYLESFARSRAPLMGDAREAVLRALALAAVTMLARQAPDARVRRMAAKTLRVHGGVGEESKKQASRREWAAASALLADIARACARAREFDPLVDALQEILAGADEGAPMARYVKWYPLAVELAYAAGMGSATLQLQSARALLAWTRAPAERVGYGEAEEEPETESCSLPVAGRAREGLCEPAPARNDPLRPSATSPATGERSSPRGGAPP